VKSNKFNRIAEVEKPKKGKLNIRLI
jgi:hypothetical protein